MPQLPLILFYAQAESQAVIYAVLCPPNTSDISMPSSAASMLAVSSFVSSISAAPAFSLSLSAFHVPGIGIIPFEISHASDIAAGDAFFSLENLSSKASSS